MPIWKRRFFGTCLSECHTYHCTQKCLLSAMVCVAQKTFCVFVQTSSTTWDPNFRNALVQRAGKPASLARSSRFLRPTGRCPRPLLNKTAWAREESWVRPSLQPWARSLREHGRGLGWTSDLLQRPATSPTLGSCRAGLARRIFLPAQTGVTSCLSRSGTT